MHKCKWDFETCFSLNFGCSSHKHVVWLKNNLANYSRVIHKPLLGCFSHFWSLIAPGHFHCMEKKHSFCFSFCFSQKRVRTSPGFGTTWGLSNKDRIFIFKVNYPYKLPDIDTSCSCMCLNKPFLCHSLWLQRTFLGPKVSRSTLPDSIPSLPPTRVKKAICLIKLWDVEQTESDLFSHYLDQKDCANRPQLG